MSAAKLPSVRVRVMEAVVPSAPMVGVKVKAPWSVFIAVPSALATSKYPSAPPPYCSGLTRTYQVPRLGLSVCPPPETSLKVTVLTVPLSTCRWLAIVLPLNWMCQVKALDSR